MRWLIHEQFLVGECFGNAIAECFFSTLECEFIDQYLLQIKTKARMGALRIHKKLP